MNITVSTKHSGITQSMKDYAHEKASKLDKYRKITKIEVLMKIEGESHIVEVCVSLKQGTPLMAEHAEKDMTTACDLVMDKIERQLTKLKERVKGRRQKKQKAEGESETTQPAEEKEETYSDVIDKLELK